MASSSSDDKKKNDSLDGSGYGLDGSGCGLDGSAGRISRSRRLCPKDDDEHFAKLVAKDAPRRSLSQELDGSLVIGDTWKSMNTVHRGKQEFGDSSDSLMDDSFAGSSFSTQDSFAEGEITDKISAQFTSLDDDSSSGNNNNNPTARRATPRRTYSKQRKQMPKKVDPLQAISEDGDGDSE